MGFSPSDALEQSILAYLRGVKPGGATEEEIIKAFSGWGEAGNRSEVREALKRLAGSKLFLLNKAIRALPPWCHGTKGDPPPGFQWKLRGTLNQLASWVCPGPRLDTRRLKRKALNKNSSVWIRRIHRTRYEVWFKNERDFQIASGRSK
jgi:hypothetical protein